MFQEQKIRPSRIIHQSEHPMGQYKEHREEQEYAEVLGYLCEFLLVLFRVVEVFGLLGFVFFLRMANVYSYVTYLFRVALLYPGILIRTTLVRIFLDRTGFSKIVIVYRFTVIFMVVKSVTVLSIFMEIIKWVRSSSAFLE